MNCDCVGPGTTRLWDCRETAAQLKTHACVCVKLQHVHTLTCAQARTHRWQRNLAEALICRLDAGLSFLLAATPCYRSFSTTLELITFTWRGQLTDNIVKTFLAPGRPWARACAEFATTVSRRVATQAHGSAQRRQRNMTTFLSPRQLRYE